MECVTRGKGWDLEVGDDRGHVAIRCQGWARKSLQGTAEARAEKTRDRGRAFAVEMKRKGRLRSQQDVAISCVPVPGGRE